MMLMFKRQAERLFIGSRLGIVGTPFKGRRHFDVEMVDRIVDFALSGFSDKERTDWLVVLKGNSQGSIRRENAVIIGMTVLGMNAEQRHIIYNAPMLSKLVRVQEMVFHLLDEQDLIEEKNVGLISVRTIICNSDISNRNIRQGREIRMETGNGHVRAVNSYNMCIGAESTGIRMGVKLATRSAMCCHRSRKVTISRHDVEFPCLVSVVA